MTEPEQIVSCCPPTDPEDERRKASPARGPSRRILVVDDDPLQRRLLDITLTRRGFDVACANDGADALGQARAHRPDAILSDVRMPRLDGFGLCSAIRADPALATVPVVLHSCQSVDAETQRQADGAGANLFVGRSAGDLQPVLDALASVVDMAAAAPAASTAAGADPLSCREIAQRYHALMDHAQDAIGIVDDDGTVVEVNRAWLEMVDLPRSRVIGRSFVELLVSDASVAVIADFKTWLQRGATARQNVRLRHNDGRIIEVDVTVAAAEIGDRRMAIATARDMTARNQIEAQLRQTQKIDAIGQLASGVAHDFNNILSVILTNCEFLLDELPPGDPRREDALDVRKAAERAAALTRQLTAFSRKQVLEPQVVRLNSAIADVWKMIQRVIGEHIHVETCLLPDVGNSFFDVAQIEQVVLNLVINARDAMPTGGTLTLETANVELDASYVASHPGAKAGHYVMLAVSDTGSGMTDEVRARIFEPFFTTKERGKGTGLGLSMVYGIVKQSDGYITAYSEVGCGSVFKVYLPRVDAEPQLSSEPLADDASARATQTILLLEDDELVRNSVRRILKGRGYTVLTAQSGTEARALCDAHPGAIDLLLSDVVLPEMSGPTVAAQLTQLRPSMKVIFMSGFTDHAIVRSGVLAAGVNFIQKPFTLAALLKKLRVVLAG